MGKPTKIKQPSKVDSQSKHGQQSSLESFFKKKSELPSPLFTQVISTSQKVLKKKKSLGISSDEAVLTATTKASKGCPALSLLSSAQPSSAQHDSLVIPATPESMQSSRTEQTFSLLGDINQDMAYSPLSQTVIPDTPENELPKKRPFTSLLNRSRDNLNGNNKVDSTIDSSEDLKFGKETGRLHTTLPCASRSDTPKMKLNSKGSPVESDNKANCLKFEKKPSSSGVENEISSKKINGNPRTSSKLSRLSRKHNKLPKSSNGVASKSDKRIATLEETEEQSVERLQECQENRTELKPAVCRVRSTSKKTSKLSLSRKVQKDVETSMRPIKRSPSRGNSPYSKRFQDSNDTLGDGLERVKKSLLEEYSIDRDVTKESSKATSHAASMMECLKQEERNRQSVPHSSEGHVSNRTPSANESLKSDESLFGHDSSVSSEHSSPCAEASAANLLLLEKIGSPNHQMSHDSDDKPAKSYRHASSFVGRSHGSNLLTDNVSSLKKLCALDKTLDKTKAPKSRNDLEEFISVIPDSCPTQHTKQQDILVIPDTCPTVENTPERTAPDDVRKHSSISQASGAEAFRTPSLFSQELENKVQSDRYTASQTVNSLSLKHHSIHEKGKQEREVDRSNKSLSKSSESKLSVSTENLQISVESSESKTDVSIHDQTVQETISESSHAQIDQNSPTVTDSTVSTSKPFDTDARSPGTAALLEGLDDSFLDEIDLDQLDAMQGTKMKENPVSSISKKLGEMSPFKTKPVDGSRPNLPADLCRYLVTGIQDSNSEKKLSIRNMSDQREQVCILKDTWQGTLIEEGMVIAIHGKFSTDGATELNNQSGYLVVNPDHLLTGTAVSNSIRCMRRSVLSENFKGLERGNRAMLLGSLLHEVFDKAILQNEFQKSQLMQIARDVLKQPAFLCDMYSLKVDENNLLEEVEEYADTIKRWSDTYLGSKSKGNVDIKWPGSFKSENCGLGVSRVTDIEETIWSPRWGVKGKVDLTVEVKIHRPSSSRPTHHTLPLELKTGRETNSIEHRSQLILYSIMLGDLQPSPDLGFLLYLKTAALKAVPANHLDKRELIHLRNQLAYYLSRTARSKTTPTAPSSADWPSQTTPSLIPPELPEPIRDDFTCKRCAHLQACSSLHRLDGSSSMQLSSSVEELFKESIEHLSDTHLHYFAHWYLLCSLEHEATKKNNRSKNIWCKESTVREKDGECWSKMRFLSCTPKDQQNGGYTLVFSREHTIHGGDGDPLDKCSMSSGDRVVISVEGTRRVAICVGFIDTVGKTDIKISSDSQLKKDDTGSTIYRIDKDDSYNSMAASLVNLAKLMKPEHAKLRSIAIDKVAPTSIHKPNLPSRARGEVASIMKDLNEDQRAAIKAVLRSQDYTLIIGMPGTGKTTTIVALVRILVACGMSVLLTSYTHSAVDNILLKLAKFKIDILRLGSEHNIHPELRRFSDTKLMKEASGVSQLAVQMERKKVVATTSLGMKHALFTRHSFDVCIVDEASQISQPVCLGPLFSASKFVLVGDQCQLPPLVQSSRARNLGMDESLFQRLVSAHKSSTMRLSLQFRMNTEIMSISNHMVYDGAMRCGNDAIAMATVSLPNFEEWRKVSQVDPWLVDALKPSTVVSFLNTDQMYGPSAESSPDNTNQLEASLVRMIVKNLMQAGCSSAQIGVISPYRRQCQLLVSTLADLGSKVKSVEVNTVDKYQGRDKDIIIVSFSHSRTESQGGSILNDLRRLNVAMTRAKHKLLLIGGLKCLVQFEPVQKLAAFLQQHQLIRNLPHEAIQEQ